MCILAYVNEYIHIISIYISYYYYYLLLLLFTDDIVVFFFFWRIFLDILIYKMDVFLIFK